MCVRLVSIISVFTLIALALGACAQRARYGEPGPVYPADVTQSDVLNIQIVQMPRYVQFTNTSARSILEARLWLNAWFSAPVSDISVGETVKVKLNEFADEHGGRPRSGGFFAARESEPLVLAQLEIAGEFFGLVLVSPDAR